MTLTDSLHYLVVGNPVSKVVIGTANSLFTKGISSTPPAAAKMSTNVSKTVSGNALPSLYKMAGRNNIILRFAGLSGAAAVIMGAIGAHQLDKNSDSKDIFDNANKFHLFHSMVLIGVPLAKYPLFTGSLFVVGTSFFSGLLYYRALTGDKQFSRYAPFGAFCLIAAWISLML